MKLKLITFTALSALSLVGSAIAQDQNVNAPERHRGHGGRGREMLDRITERLNLTPEQKAKIQPIVDQAKPKMAAIHQEAMQKAKTVLDEAMAQIRPMLTPEQQKQLEEARNRRGGRQGKGSGEDESF